MKFNNINEFNDYISNNLTKYDIITYFNKIHELFNNNTDISFMEYFLSLVDKNDEFCVDHTKLIEYGVINTNRSNHIKECIENFEFKKNIDYIIFAAERSAANKRGGHNAKHYKMKPHVFKICLMQSKNEKKYAKYFVELEKCFYYYKDYQVKYQEVLLSGKDEKYDKFVEESKKRHEELLNSNKKQSEEIQELLEYAKETVHTLHEVQDDLIETKEEVIVAKSYLEDKSITSTLNPTNDNLHHYFAATTYILNDIQVIKFVTGQRAYVDRIIANNVLNKNHTIIIDPFYNANGIDLRQNVYAEYIKRRDERINEINTTNQENDKLYNNALKKEISKYNKLKPNTKRVFKQEKQITPRVGIQNMPVRFGKTSVEYRDNTYIQFDEIIQIILDINNITQATPLP